MTTPLGPAGARAVVERLESALVDVAAAERAAGLPDGEPPVVVTCDGSTEPPD